MPFKTTKTAEEKLSIVLEGLKAETSISDICRKHGLSQTLYYKWRDKFLEGGKKGLMNSSGGSSGNHDKSKLEEYEKVIGRQTIEIQILKKNLNLI
jgi:transposase-like protein